MTDNQQAATEIAQESPEAAGLMYQIITASMDANNRTMDTLYEMERQRRQALEVSIDLALDALTKCWGGTVREYEQAIDVLRYPAGTDSQLAAMHHENKEIS